MKTIIAAGIIGLALTGAASAGDLTDEAVLDQGVYNVEQGGPEITSVAWIGRYGQVCHHGPVWIAACHASNRPGPYIRGHWNAMRTRWIPGRYS